MAPGADCQLVLRGVEDIQEQVALPGTVGKTEGSSGSRAAETRACLSPFPGDFPLLEGVTVR